MNEMSPEEYRDKLQESISARQAARREAAKRSGIIGNRSSNGYLDGLSRPQNNDKGKRDTSLRMTTGVGLDVESVEDIAPGNEDENELAVGAASSDEKDEEPPKMSNESSDKPTGKARVSVESGYDAIASRTKVPSKEGGGQHGSQTAVADQKGSQPTPPADSKRPDDPPSPILHMKRERAERELGRRSEWRDGDPDRSTHASRLVPSSTTTNSFAHGTDGSRSHGPVRTSTSTDEGAGYFSVHGQVETRVPRVDGGGIAGGLANADDGGAATRQRPVPPSEAGDRRVETTVRGAGDVRTGGSATASDPEPSSLVGSEQRLRPAPTADGADRPQPSGSWKFVGDVRLHSVRHFRPVPKSSLVGTESRVRPVPGTAAPGHARVVDMRSPGDGNALTRRPTYDDSRPASLSGDEVRARPAPVFGEGGTGTVGDHRGPGDENSLTRRLRPDAARGGSLAEDERRSRPVVSSGSSHQSETFREVAADHRGPGDGNSLTRRLRPDAAPGGSLAEDEQRSRPVVSSGSSHQASSFAGKRVGDHRGPGDDRSLTRRSGRQNAAESTASLADDEQRSRPRAPSSSSSSPELMVDHRGPGDTRTLTKKSASGSPDPVSTLTPAGGGGSSGAARSRHRPVPGSGRTGNFETVGDRTGAGTRPKKRRPQVGGEAGGVGPAPAVEEDGEDWWGERTQRVPPRGSAPPPTSADGAALLSRATDTTHRNTTRAPARDVEETVPLLKSLVSEGERSRYRRTEDDGPRPRHLAGALGPSFMQTLLTEAEAGVPTSPAAGGGEDPGVLDGQDPTSPGEPSLTSLAGRGRHVLRSQSPDPDVREGWWGELTQRPAGYVRHAQTLRTTYEDRNEAPRGWGDVVTSSSDDYFGSATDEDKVVGGEERRRRDDDEEEREPR